MTLRDRDERFHDAGLVDEELPRVQLERFPENPKGVWNLYTEEARGGIICNDFEEAIEILRDYVRAHPKELAQ